MTGLGINSYYSSGVTAAGSQSPLIENFRVSAIAVSGFFFELNGCLLTAGRIYRNKKATSKGVA